MTTPQHRRQRWRVAVLGAAVICCSAVAADGSDGTDAARNYLQYCSGCHRLDGSGSAANRVPTFAGSVGHFVRTGRGRAFLIQVGGVAQSALTDAEIADLLNWLLPQYGGREMPPAFSPYTAAEVHAKRSHRPADLMAARTVIARELHDLGYSLAVY